MILNQYSNPLGDNSNCIYPINWRLSSITKILLTSSKCYQTFKNFAINLPSFSQSQPHFHVSTAVYKTLPFTQIVLYLKIQMLKVSAYHASLI